MNNKDFDDALKKKLESVSFYQASNAEVDQVISYVNANLSPISKRRKSFAAFAALLVASMLVLIGFNVYQLKDRQLLTARIDSLHQSIKKNSTAIVHDTILVHDPTAIIHPSLENKFISESESHDITATIPPSFVLNKNKKTDNPTSSSAFASSILFNSNASSNIPLDVSQLIPFLESSKADVSPQASKNGIEKQANEIRLNESKQLDSTLSVDNKLIAMEDDTIDAGTFNPEKNTYSSFLKSISTQLVLSTNFFPTKLAVGLAARFNLSHTWGLQVGIDKSHYARANFHDEDDYRRGRREDFRKTYALSAADSQAVTNINIQYNCIQVPLQVFYKKHLMKHLDCVAAIGTTIDVHVSEITNYRRPSSSGFYAEKPIRVERKVSTPLISNAQLSAGIELSVNKFTFSATPSFSYQVSNVAYQKNTASVGGMFRLLYSL